MAIVNAKSDLFRDELTGGDYPDYSRVAGRVHFAQGTITNAATDSSGSTYKLCAVPANAILNWETFFDVENWGFAAVRIGTLTDVDALVSALVSAATSQSPIVKGDANHGKALWEVLGLAENPGGEIMLYAHAIADATGAGSMPFIIAWVDN